MTEPLAASRQRRHRARHVAVALCLASSAAIALSLIVGGDDGDGADDGGATPQTEPGPAGPLDFAQATRRQIEQASGLEFGNASRFRSLQQSPTRLFVTMEMSDDQFAAFVADSGLDWSSRRSIRTEVPGMWSVNVDDATFESSVSTRAGVERILEAVRVDGQPVVLRIQLTG